MPNKKTPNPKPLFQPEPRAKTVIEYRCYGPPEMFLPTEKVPANCWKDIELFGPLPCGGGGVPGAFCEKCRYGIEVVIESEILQK